MDPSLFFVGYGKLTDDGYVEERIQSQQKPIIQNNEVEVIHNTEETVKEEDKADPISLHHGSMVYDQTLMQLPSKGEDLMFKLHYNSILDYEYTPLGKGWDHNFNKFLAFSEYDNKLYFGNGNGIPSSFANAGDNIWKSDALRATVLKLPNNDMRMTFTNGGSIRFRPIKLGYQEVMYRPYVITDRNGHTQFLSWNNDDLLQSVEDSSGNTINFTYNNDDKLTRVEEI